MNPKDYQYLNLNLRLEWQYKINVVAFYSHAPALYTFKLSFLWLFIHLVVLWKLWKQIVIMVHKNAFPLFMATTSHLFTAITKSIPALLPCCHYLLKTTKSFKFCWCHYCITASLCMIPWFMTCLRVWLRLLFKVFFVPKYIKMMFFLFFKNYFWNQRIKTIQNT